MIKKDNIKKEIDFIRYFSKNGGHGNGLFIKGGVRKGKSTLVSLITKILIEQSNFAIISNVRFHNFVYEKYSSLYFINSLEMYLKYYSEIPYTKPILIVWDDAQATEGMTSKDVMGKAGKNFAQFLIWIGKLQTSYIFVAHQKYIPAPLLEGFEPLIIYKNNRTQFVLSDRLYDNDSDANHDSNNLIIPMPKPNLIKLDDGNFRIDVNDENYLPIMSRAFTSFEFNIDMQELNKSLTNFDVGENLKEAVLEFLDINKNKDNNSIQDIKNYTYENIYIALCLKKGKILSNGEILRDLINSNIINEARKKLRKIGLE